MMTETATGQKTGAWMMGFGDVASELEGFHGTPEEAIRYAARDFVGACCPLPEENPGPVQVRVWWETEDNQTRDRSATVYQDGRIEYED